MKRLIPCDSSVFKVFCTFTFENGETTDKEFYIPKRQKEETLIRVFDLNPRIIHMVARSKKGVIIFEKTKKYR